MATKNIFQPCTKCAGTGKISGFEHVANGVCFKCGGSRGVLVAVEAELTDAEVIQQLRDMGIDIVFQEWNAESDDPFAEMEAYSRRRADAMIGARAMLAGLAA